MAPSSRSRRRAGDSAASGVAPAHRRQHRRVDGEIGFAHEALRGVDELLEVLDALLAVLLRPVVREQAGGLDRRAATASGSGSDRGRVARIASISRTNAASARPRLAASACRAQAACHSDVPCARAASCSCSSVRAPMPRGGKLTTRRNAPSSSGVGDQAQVRERMLDLRALEEAHAAVHAIRNAPH